MSSLQRSRFFSFDTVFNKYRYYRSREAGKDVESKAMYLARGRYEVQDQVNTRLKCKLDSKVWVQTRSGMTRAEDVNSDL